MVPRYWRDRWFSDSGHVKGGSRGVADGDDGDRVKPTVEMRSWCGGGGVLIACNERMLMIVR